MDRGEVLVGDREFGIDRQYQPVPARRGFMIALHEIAGGDVAQPERRARSGGVRLEGLRRDQMRERAELVAETELRFGHLPMQ